MGNEAEDFARDLKKAVTRAKRALNSINVRLLNEARMPADMLWVLLDAAEVHLADLRAEAKKKAR